MIDAMHRPEQALAEVRRLLPALDRQIDHHRGVDLLATDSSAPVWG
jgi:hypothetical protein